MFIRLGATWKIQLDTSIRVCYNFCMLTNLICISDFATKLVAGISGLVLALAIVIIVIAVKKKKD